MKFLRHYGPVARNDNMYDETIQRSARRLGIAPIDFEHPHLVRVLECFAATRAQPVSVILTGTAGDGKTHLCRHVWGFLGGDQADWASDNPYLNLDLRSADNRKGASAGDPSKFPGFRRVHFIRDLSAWAAQHGGEWEPEKEALLLRFCQSLFEGGSDELFLIAANDGQLIEAFRRLRQTDATQRALRVFEDLLVEDRQEQTGVRLAFFNLSRSSSADVFDRAVDTFLAHPGWETLKQALPEENGVFGPKCPIRCNYELLGSPLVRTRLRSLLELCDHNGLHVPIRQILLLLTNAVLGHPDVKDHLMQPADVPKVIAAGTVSKASLYSNVFGANLTENRRRGLTIFDYFERFQIGHETCNRVDNILIFGQDDPDLGNDFDELVANDTLYGADERFYAARQEYIEGSNENDAASQSFLDMLISQRRGLFFKIPEEAERELKLWELTVFKFAGEYLDDVVGVLKGLGTVKRPILSRLVKGLNRVFTGMLINSDRELYLATSGNYSQAKVSRILIDLVSVDPSKGEKIVVRWDPTRERVLLSVYFTPELIVDFDLTLIRFEFLSRIAMDGALPASFSKECYEDLLAFKSQLIAGQRQRQATEEPTSAPTIHLRILTLTDQGNYESKSVEVTP